MAERYRFTLMLAFTLAVGGAAFYLLWSLQGESALTTAVNVARLTYSLAMISSAVLFSARWFLLDEPSSAWMACALAMLLVYLRPELVPTAEYGAGSLVVPSDIGVMLLMVWVIGNCSRGTQVGNWRRPLLIGIGAGLLFSGVRLVWFSMNLDVPWLLTAGVVMAVYPLASAMCARYLLTTEAFPLELRWHLVVPLTLGVAYVHFMPEQAESLGAFSLVGAAVLALAGVDLFATAVSLVRRAFQEHARRMAMLEDRAYTAEEVAHHQEEVWHECRATMAGISSATQLLVRNAEVLGPEQQHLLREMLGAEMDRLQHLLEAPADGSEVPVEPVVWDDVVHPLVLSLRAQGMQIEAEPTGLSVLSRPEVVATAAHVLLRNSQRHAPGARVVIRAEAIDDQVEVHFVDDGPGIPEHMHGRLFRRGGRADESPGEGLGLYSARRDIRELGGDLHFVPSERGAQFTLTLPR